jgi:hypothetical protein
MSAAMIREYESDPQAEWFELASQTGDWKAER